VREITFLYTYYFTFLVTMNNQISVTSKKHFAETIFESSQKYLTLCSIYAIKVVTFMKSIKHTPRNCILSVYVLRS
jgi:hypothetical protein